MSEHYLVDTNGNTIGIVVDPATYQELIQACEKLRRIRAVQAAIVPLGEATEQQHSVRELRGLGRDLWTGFDVQTYIEEERNS